MDLNKETPHTKSEKAAVKALIEASGLECSPMVQTQNPELESWVHKRKKENTYKQKRVPSVPLYTRPISNIGKPPTYVSNTMKSTTNRTQRPGSQMKSTREKSFGKNMQIPLIPLLFPSNINDSKTKASPIPVQNTKKRSQSLAECKENIKPADIPIIKKVISLMVKNNLRVKVNKENNLIPKSKANRLALFPKLLGSKNI